MGGIDYLADGLNAALADVGTGANPSLANLILHSPIDRGLISESNLENLTYAKKSFGETYEKKVLPKFKGVFRSITQDDYENITKKRIPRFQKRSGTSIRNKLRESYRGDFDLKEVTNRALFSREDFHGDYGENAKFWFNASSDYMLSFRHKKEESIKDKLRAINDRYGDGLSISHVTDITLNNYSFWDNRNDFLAKCKGESLMMLNDLFGIKIVDLNQERFKERAEELVKSKGVVNFHNFDLAFVRNHLDRNAKFRPGGFHYTLTDKSLPGFPVEVQYRSLQDEVLNMLGENNSSRYGAEGKKNKDKFND